MSDDLDAGADAAAPGQGEEDVAAPSHDESIDALIAAAKKGVAGAQEQATSQLEESDATIARDQESTRRFVIISLLVIYALVLLIYSMWVIFGPSTIPGYVCADEAAQRANLCAGRWAQTRDALKDVVVAWVLPVLTLAIGYYFGKAAEGEA